MNKILAITGLTWKSAFRYRLFWVMLVLLIAAVVGLPLILHDDGTAKGLTQILLTYTLSAVVALLGFATLWLSCGTLAKDVEECQMQVVAVKPIARWQIWLGKWLGMVTLDAVLLALAGAGIFFLLQWRAARLPASEQRILREDVFVSRASIREPPPDLSPVIEQEVARRVGKQQFSATDLSEIRQQVTAEITSALTEVQPGYSRWWAVNLQPLKDHLRDQPLLLRIKFHTANPDTDKQYPMLWIVGPTNAVGQMALQEKFPPDSFQEFAIPPNLFDDQGRLYIQFVNPNDISIIFPLDEGVELLYPESSFGVNFIRGLLIILCWLALLASLGLACASFLSFPVAAFVSLALLLLGLSSRTIGTVVTNGTITSYDSAKSGFSHSPVDLILVPIFRGALKIINLVEAFSPIDFLSSGRSITWGELGSAVMQIVFLLGGFFCAVGMILFARRELATAQGNN